MSNLLEVQRYCSVVAGCVKQIRRAALSQYEPLHPMAPMPYALCFLYRGSHGGRCAGIWTETAVDWMIVKTNRS